MEYEQGEENPKYEGEAKHAPNERQSISLFSVIFKYQYLFFY